MNKFTMIMVFSLIAAVPFGNAQTDILVSIQNISPEEINFQGFKLNYEQEVEIEAVGFRGRKRGGLVYTRAWILDTQTRQVIWEMEDAEIIERDRRTQEYRDVIELAEGEYEVYYSSYPFSSSWQVDGFGDFIGRILHEIFDSDDYVDEYGAFKEEWRKFKIVVRGDGRSYDEEEVAELHKSFNKNTVVSMTALRDEAHLEYGFELKRPLDLRVYALGEIRKDGTYDYGWIINTQTREKVWKMTYRNTESAGGARKNRMVDEVVSLPAGRYVATFITDDSHSYRRWNAAPPYDPMFWGMTLKVEDPVMKKYVELFDYEDMPEENIILQFTRVRDNEFLNGGFTLKKPMHLRIYALGEGRRNEMFDYGWIVDAKTHKKIWEMDFYNSEHAGGGEKNRLFDEVMEFDKGNYIVNYVTDGSHSYWNWNTAPPIDQEKWGITISCAEKHFNKKDVAKYEASEDKSVLAQIVRVSDYERERKRFTLRKDSEIRIYAIGEGKGGKMYDYAWIEDADSRRVVWEMTYNQTDHAGGASKNRLFDDTILLKKGEYIVYYETDDSHSFNDWNVAPPYDPAHWGVTIYLVEEK
ncbi:MAG: hypothetical protein ACE5HS_16075 [bacterium]